MTHYRHNLGTFLTYTTKDVNWKGWVIGHATKFNGTRCVVVESPDRQVWMVAEAHPSLEVTDPPEKTLPPFERENPPGA